MCAGASASLAVVSDCQLTFPFIHTDPFGSQLCLWAGESGQAECLQGGPHSPETLQQQRALEQKYNPRREAAGRSGGTTAAEEFGVFTGETTGHGLLAPQLSTGGEAGKCNALKRTDCIPCGWFFIVHQFLHTAFYSLLLQTNFDED